jgi:transcriptional regulator with XRE-family HTH domain
VSSSLLAAVRDHAGLSQADLAARAGTSRPTLSAYEHGRISPTLDTFVRILGAAGQRLDTVPVIRWREVDVGRGRTAAIPDRLPDLRASEALRRVELPLHLEWSRSVRTVDLSDRQQRARVYELVLREGRPADIESMVDGALLVDQWNDLVLPRRIRAEWQPLIDELTGNAASHA